MALVVKNLTANAGRCERHRFDPWDGKITWKKAWQSTLVFLPGESHGQRGLAGRSAEGHEVSDMIEGTYHTHPKSKILKRT